MRLAFLDSPITRAELRYQPLPLLRSSKLRLVLQVALWFSLLISMIFILGGVVFAVTERDAGSLVNALYPFNYILFAAVLVTHFSALLQTLLVAYRSIAQEKESKTWDLLMLTHMDCQHIVLGKWWASLYQTWQMWLLAGLLRTGLVIWLGIEAARGFTRYGSLVYLDPFNVLLAGIALIWLGMFNMGMTAAFSLLASLIARRNGEGLALAIISQALPLVIIGAPLWILGNMLQPPYSGLLYLVVSPGLYQREAVSALLQTVGLTLLDNGSAMAINITWTGSLRYFDSVHPLIYVVISLSLYGFLTWLALRIAQALAIRQGALPPAHVRANENSIW
jgi:hypothetical protein